MKYWRGFLVAGIVFLITFALKQFCAAHTELIDMIYPYVDRIIIDYLAGWSANFAGCLWQTILVFVMVLLIASVVLMIVLRWNPIQWSGWVLAFFLTLNLLNTGIYGLNQYSGPIYEDIRMEYYYYSIPSLERAATYYRDKAIEYSQHIDRKPDGSVNFSDFDTLAVQAAEGFDVLAYDRTFSIYTGTTTPVKQLGWADKYNGTTGITVGLTGESAVNPNVPAVGLPFAICHEMAHRMCIYNHTDADFSAFLACTSNPSAEYAYSGYLMAFRSCYNALAAIQKPDGIAAMDRLMKNTPTQIMEDMNTYNAFLGEQAATVDADLCNLLVSWHIQEVARFEDSEAENDRFDPMDETEEKLQDMIQEIVGGGS